MIIISPSELFALLASLLPNNPIIVEAGSCDGRDTFQLARQFPHGKIYAFEPVPLLYKALKERVACYCNVMCINKALADTCSMREFHVARKIATQRITQTSSLYTPNQRYSWENTQFDEIISVWTITLDTWMKELAIDHIDFLWLDAQGAELSILFGAQHALQTIKALWIEVSDVQRYTNQPTAKEITTTLQSYGFSPIAESAPHKIAAPYKRMLFVQSVQHIL